jgi:hypothetical protein
MLAARFTEAHHGSMKRFPALLLTALALSSCATLAPRLGIPAAVPDEAPSWAVLASGVEYASFASTSPRVAACALRIDLGAKGLEPVVTPGKDGMTKSQYVSGFARQYGCVAAVNATPFEPSSAVEGEGRKVVGLTIADGIVVSPPAPPMAVLILRREGDGGLCGEVALQAAGPRPLDGDGRIVAAVGGFQVVLSGGSPKGGAKSREPRTAVGLSADGRVLYILVADGRRRDSAGLTNYETGCWLKWLGAAEGMTLDGGGSSAMAIRDAKGIVRVVNVPVEGGRPGRERAVGSCLGFRAIPTP